MSVPKVAVIVCTYNMAHYLQEALDSVLALKYPNMEIIVVDDGSTDGTASLIKEKYLDKVTYIHQANQGLFGARNTGIAAADDADYYSIIDADDKVHPLKVWDEVAYLERFPDAVVCFSNLMAFEKELDDPTDIWDSHARLVWDGRKLIASDELWGEIKNPIEKIAKYTAFTSATTMRASTLRAIGGYDDTLKCSGDMDIAIRLTREGKFGFINKVRYLNRREGQGMTAYMMDRVIVYIRIFEKVWETSQNYNSEELELLKQQEKLFLWRALQGIAVGRVEPSLQGLVQQNFLRYATRKDIMKLVAIRCVKFLGIGKAIAKWKTKRRRKTYNANNPIGLEDVLGDNSPCFDSITP